MAGLIGNWVTALMMTNVAYLQVHPNTPALYSSGVYYLEEPMGEEDFFDIPTVLRQGYADCEDLAAWRAAEYLVVGRWAAPLVTWEAIEYPTGNIDLLFHVQVQTQYGIEDPSVVLGMGRGVPGGYGFRLTG